MHLITGGSSRTWNGNGKRIGQAGAKIVVNGHSSQETLDNAVAEYKSVGIEAYGYIFDVTDEASSN